MQTPVYKPDQIKPLTKLYSHWVQNRKFTISQIVKLCESESILIRLVHPSQNMPADGKFPAYDAISAAYFTLKFINNNYEVSSSSNWNDKYLTITYFREFGIEIFRGT